MAQCFFPLLVHHLGSKMQYISASYIYMFPCFVGHTALNLAGHLLARDSNHLWTEIAVRQYALKTIQSRWQWPGWMRISTYINDVLLHHLIIFKTQLRDYLSHSNVQQHFSSSPVKDQCIYSYCMQSNGIDGREEWETAGRQSTSQRPHVCPSTWQVF